MARNSGATGIVSRPRAFWLCTDAGEMRFYEPANPLEQSLLVPDFPVRVQLPFEA